MSAKPPKYISTESKMAMKKHTRAGITSDLNKQRDMAVYYLKASGEFDAAI
jgi:hypothetical protein